MKKLVLAAIAVALLLTGCSDSAAPAAAPGKADAIQIVGSGTEDDPWLVGASDHDDIQAFVIEESLFINGCGRMMDFPAAEVAPWHETIADVSQICIFTDQNIGANAFSNAGTNKEYLDVYFPDAMSEIGAGAFKNANLGEFTVMNLPLTIEKIGSQAFANTAPGSVYLYSHPDIAEDAFADAATTVYYLNGAGWDEQDFKPYGGEINYIPLRSFNYICDSGSDEFSGEGTMYIPDGEMLDFNAEYEVDTEEYRFVRFEVLDGELSLDTTDPAIFTELTDNVRVKIIYEKK